MRVVAYVPDLMDRSKFGGLDADKVFVRTTDELIAEAPGADVVVLDLSRPGVIEAVGALGDVRKVGFMSHVDGEGISAAKNAGIEAMPRSRFFSHLVEIVTQSSH